MTLTRARLEELVDVRRREWDPGEPTHPQAGSRLLESIIGVEIHWPGPGSWLTRPFAESLASIERYHEESLGWSDAFYNVAYHVPSRTFVEVRDATVASQSSLEHWLTVLILAGEGDTLTGDDVASIEAGIRRAHRAVTPSHHALNSLRGHGERSASACPGPIISNVIDRVRSTPQQPGGSPMILMIDTDGPHEGEHWIVGGSTPIDVTRSPSRAQHVADFAAAGAIIRAAFAGDIVRKAYPPAPADTSTPVTPSTVAAEVIRRIKLLRFTGG